MLDEVTQLLVDSYRRRQALGAQLIEELELAAHPPAPRPVPTRYVGAATFKAYTPRRPR